MKEDRIYFFSPSDLSIGYYLEKVENVIERYKKTPPKTLEDVLEMYHIKLLIASGCRLKNWKDEKYAQLKQAIEGYSSIIASFFNQLSSEEIILHFPTLSWEYKQSFWDVIEQFNLLKVISPETLTQLIDDKIPYLKQVLHCERIVKRHSSWIRAFLLNHEEAATLLLDQYVAVREYPHDRDIYFPAILSLEDKEKMINHYLDSSEPNLNFVKLICQIKNEKEQNTLVLSPKTRVKAERLSEKLNNELLTSGRASIMSYRPQILFSDEDNIPPLDFKIDENGFAITYSVKYIERCSPLKLFYNCISLFGWMNQHFMLELISKRGENSTIEMIIPDHGRFTYPDFLNFKMKNHLAFGTLRSYDNILNQMGTSFEQTLKTFYEVHLKECYGYCGFELNFPKTDDSWLNKCRILFPELDSVVKQYNTYVDYGEVDGDIIRYASPVKMTEGKSLLTNKYYELTEGDNDIHRILYCMYDGNAMLDHVEPFKNQDYSSFMELICNEEVFYDKYKDYQKPRIDFLIDRQILVKEENGRLRLAHKDFEEILTSLWHYKACNYWHYSKEGRTILDDMEAKGWLRKSDYLLTSEERNYFSFYMDNQVYTNGYAYRNHYAHGSTPPSFEEDEHQKAYYTFLRLLYILLIKIENDLLCGCKAIEDAGPISN